ncbi:MAG: glycosyltransferase [Pseudomonadota bacterium]|nr:glycosyltransferase [Pseudomonadota bacterium]
MSTDTVLPAQPAATEQTSNSPDLCIILPIKDEQEAIVALLDDIAVSLAAVRDLGLTDVLLIAVDDHSSDDGIARLQAWHTKQEHLTLKVLRLETTQGLYLALLHGCKYAARLSPRFTAILDADGQDNPSYIPKLLELAAVSEIVFAARGRREDTLTFKICYRSFQTLMKWCSGKFFNTSHYVVMQSHVLAAVAQLNYVDFFGALLFFSHFSRQYYPVDRRQRLAGVSKFMFGQRLRLALTIFSYSRSAVIRISSLATSTTLIVGLLALVYHSRLWAALTLLAVAASFGVLMVLVNSCQRRNTPLGS